MAKPKHTFTRREVGALSGVKEDTLRAWQRRGHLPDEQSGYRRFDIRTTAAIMMFARIALEWKDTEVARRCHDLFLSHLALTADGFDQDGLWVVIYRAEISENLRRLGASGLTLHSDEFTDQETCEQFCRELRSGQTFGRTVSPLVIPIHSYWGEVALRLGNQLDQGPEQA